MAMEEKEEDMAKAMEKVMEVVIRKRNKSREVAQLNLSETPQISVQITIPIHSL